MTKHTPGPWIVNAEQIFGNGYKIASINDAGHNWQEDRDLISAAPDLLKALKAMADYMAYAEALGEDRAVFKNARAAIAKAEGSADLGD